MEWVYFLIAAAIIGAVIFYFVRKKKAAPPEFKSRVFTRSIGSTPKGVRLFGYSGTTADVKAQIDAVFDKVFVAAASRGWTNGYDYASYKVALIPNTAPSGQTPSFLIRGRRVVNLSDVNDLSRPNYDQSEYDLDPTPGATAVRAAGRFSVEAKSGVYSPIITYDDLAAGKFYMRLAVVNDPSMLEGALTHELKHALAIQNDPALFVATANHVHSDGEIF